MNVPQRYNILRAIAFILKLLAVIVLLAGVAVAIVAASASSNATGAMAGVVQMLGSVAMVAGPVIGLVWFVQLYAFGSILSLLVEIEENTRALAVQPTVQPPVQVAATQPS
jgi:hypothetical protein